MLTDPLREYFLAKTVLPYVIKGRYLDAGKPVNWLKVNIEVALDNTQYAGQLRTFMRQLLNEEGNQ